MITRLKVTNFKSLRELEVEFGRFTVIVGPNGCGKSSVLQAAEMIRDACDAKDISWPFSSPVKGARSTSVTYEIQVESWLFEGTGSALKSGRELGIRVRSDLDTQWTNPFHGPHRDLLQELLRHIGRYQLDKTNLEQASFSYASKPKLGYRGEDLASVLDAMQGERREQFEAIESALCQFVPGLRRVRLQRVPSERPQGLLGHQVVLDFEFARHVVANDASEGTILLLGLLTVIGAESGPPSTIMLDDLDRGLHPKAQKQLVAHLHALLDQRPELQIIATTHSPYLVEHLEYEEVLAMTQSPVDGRSLIAPLAKHPDAARWKDEMSAGEFWSSVGEEWIANEH
jgi:predicted ATPase